MPDISVSQPGVLKLLQNLNPRKATGPDNIPARLLHTVAEEISPALTLLFNKSLHSSELPSAWRHAHVHPIFKKGDRSNAANYRPISLTSICGKMLEHIIRSSISTHFTENHILNDAQHGFRKKRSCETQLILTVNDLAKELDKRGQTDTILLDFSKAFDKVPHQRLILKLHHLGVRGSTLQWIKGFLQNRTQQVVVEGQQSRLGQVTSGVPQGSVLGPTLFLAYIDDLSHNIKAQVRLFADDTILYHQIRNESDTHQLQQDLDKLGEWETKWQMKFNIDKCHILTISKKKKPTIVDYKLHGQVLQRVSSAKYLGVELTKDLHWGAHIQTSASKANKISAFVYRNIRGCPINVHTNCYKGLVRPIMEYAATVWDPHQQVLSNSLEKVQRRAARRIMQDFSPTTSASELVSRLNLQPLSDRRVAARAMMMYKIVNGLVDLQPQDGTLKPNPRPSRGQPGKILVPYTRTDTFRHSFFPSAIRTWNAIPPSAFSADSPEAFKRCVEDWVRSHPQ